MEIKQGWEGKGAGVEPISATSQHVLATFKAGFVPSAQNNTMWVYLAVVKEVYKQMNLFLSVLELPAKFKQHPMSGTGTSKWNDDNIYVALSLLIA